MLLFTRWRGAAGMGAERREGGLGVAWWPCFQAGGHCMHNGAVFFCIQARRQVHGAWGRGFGRCRGMKMGEERDRRPEGRWCARVCALGGGRLRGFQSLHGACRHE